MLAIPTRTRRVIAVGITGSALFIGFVAGPAQAKSAPTTYEVHIANTQPDQLTLQNATLVPGTHWVFQPPKHLNGYGNGLFEVASTSKGGAQASVTYVDSANGTTVTFTGDAAPYPTGSSASAVVSGSGLSVSGYQGFFPGLHRELNLHYAVTGTSAR